jgi:acyl-CoA reductase-like NAD-dependent aldehyde dehydrogenase
MTTLPNAPAPASAPENGTGASRPEGAATSFPRERAAQRAWAHTSMRARRRLLRCFRAELATGARELAATIAEIYPGSLNRTLADTLVAEVLPLAEACRFLEREAAFTLRTRRESTRSRPFWLRGVTVEIERAPLGVVLVIGPGNYPLFLPGVQALQALAAGNAVLWKPAPTGIACAHALRVMLIASGMPPDLLTILDASPAAATAAIAAGVDKVFLTGSATTGEQVLHDLAASATPSVMELSGCDAVFVLEGADLARVVDALVFSLRLNGSATCMAPRRVFVPQRNSQQLAALLTARLQQLAPVTVPARTREQLAGLTAEASFNGAEILLDGLAGSEANPGSISPTLLAEVTPEMRIAQTDIFAPILSLLPFHSHEHAAAMHERCPFALTAAIFGPEPQARLLAKNLIAGTILYNDIIIATADPRVPFSGRKRSGFGVTRGREGLLAMTTPRAHVRQRSRSRMPYQPTTPAHAELFAGLLRATHALGWRQRLAGWRAIAAALPGLKPRRGKP